MAAAKTNILISGIVTMEPELLLKTAKALLEELPRSEYKESSDDLTAEEKANEMLAFIWLKKSKVL